MMNSMEFSNFWEGQDSEEFLLPSFLQGDKINGKDKIDFLEEITNVAGTPLEDCDKIIDPLDNDDLLPDWMELKVDLSLLDNFDENLDNLVDLLDDPNLVIENEESIKEKQSYPLGELPSTPTGDDTSFGGFLSNELSTCSVLASPPYTNPNSPEGQVPNVITPPNSPSSVTSFDFKPVNPLEEQLDFTAVSQLEEHPELSTLNLMSPVLVQPVITYNLSDCLATQLFNEAETVIIEDVSAPPSPSESLALSYSSAEEHIVVQLEDSSTSSDALLVPAVRGSKRKSADKTFEPPLKKSTPPSVSGSSKPLPKARKERKRMQNKDAATRYRQKKRQEADVVFAQEEALLEENSKLKEKVQQISTEITYLKGLMREMFKARGILK